MTPPRAEAPRALLGRGLLGPERRHHHDVVIDVDVEMPHAKPHPLAALDALAMPAATKEDDVAVVVGDGAHLDLEERLLARRPRQLLRRDLDEIGPRQHAAERRDEIGIGGLARGVRVSGMMRVEVVVGLLQPLQFLEMLVVEDGADEPAELAELIAGVRRRRASARRAAPATISRLRTGMNRSGRSASIASAGHAPIPPGAIIREAGGDAKRRAPVPASVVIASPYEMGRTRPQPLSAASTAAKSRSPWPSASARV